MIKLKWAVLSTRAEVVEEGAKVSRIIMWLCIKPETSEINVTKVFPCKSTNISRVSYGNFGQPDHYWAVLKNIYFRPWCE